MEADDLCARRVGSVLSGKWTLEKLLGVGGMAAVYVARHKIGRLDAIKILHPELARAEQIRARFEQEAHVLNRFKHPGAVEVRDLETTDDGAPFIVMELLEGQSLADRIRTSTPTVDDTLRMADEVLDVLAAAHARGIIHRDIKPDNLFVTASGAIKVLDFGIAQLRTGAGDLKTKTGTTLGTVAYMPPEQLKGMDIDARADVYGVGATMFRMLAGTPPHRAGSEVELMMKVLSEPAPRLATVMESVRADLGRIVDRAVAFDRDARFPDARAMQTDVRAARNDGRPEIAATMAASPESALLREARGPEPSPPASQLATRVSGTEPIASSRRTSDIPLGWLLLAGAIALVALAALGTALVIAALRGHAPAAADTSSTGVPVASAPPAPYEPPAPPDEDEEDHPPGPHHPPPPHGHGPHGKHKP